MDATATAAVLDLADLTVGPEVGTGGEGTVYDVTALHRHPIRLVFKRYAAPVTGIRRRQLSRLVALRRSRSLGMTQFAWPESLVTDGGDVVGIVMPRAAGHFWTAVHLRSGRVVNRLRESQYLLFGEDKLRTLGLPFPDLSQRLELFAGLVAAVEMLHDLDLVYGDMSARNILYSTERHVGVFLLDCDGIVPTGTPSVIDSPDWRDPACPDAASAQGDVYKLGLFASRILTVSPTRQDAPPAGGAPPDLLAIIAAALDRNPASRPTVIDLATVMAGFTPGPPASGSGDLPEWGLSPHRGDLVRVGRSDAGRPTKAVRRSRRWFTRDGA